jgi:plasmid stability protein
MPKQLTIRGVPREVGLRLESISRARGQSVNATVLQILEDAVGTRQRKQRLEKYATWTNEDLVEFEEILSDQRRIDDELWR